MNLYTSNLRKHPGQPLYTLAEIGDRIGLPEMSLRSLMGKHPGFKAWATTPGNNLRSPQKLYRLTDARHWWATLPQYWESKNDASSTH